MKHLKRRWFRRFAKTEDGSVTIEFVILFPMIVSLLLMSVEVGVMMARSLMLDRGIDIAMRELRLGNLSPMTHAGLKQSICANSLILPNCEASLAVELTPATTYGWAPASSKPQCIDKSATIQPVLDFTSGQANQLMIVSACATFKPFFPTTRLAATIKLDGANEYALLATSAYSNEP